MDTVHDHTPADTATVETTDRAIEQLINAAVPAEIERLLRGQLERFRQRLNERDRAQAHSPRVRKHGFLLAGAGGLAVAVLWIVVLLLTPQSPTQPETERVNGVGFVGFSRDHFSRVQPTVQQAYKNAKWGFIDRMGKVVIEAEYRKVDDFSEGMAGVLDPEKDKWGYIDRKGRTVIEPKFEGARPFHEGLAAVKVDGKWGYLDKTGKLCVQPQFVYAGDFHAGHAPVRKEKLGYIDRTGKMIIEPRFDAGTGFHEGLAAVAIRRKSQSGRPPGMAWGFIDLTGRLVIPPQFGYAGRFSGGLAVVEVVEQDRRAGYINRDGKMVIPCVYDRAYPFSSSEHWLPSLRGLALVVVKDVVGNEKFGFINKTGAMVIEPDYLLEYEYSKKEKAVIWKDHDPLAERTETTRFDASRVGGFSEGFKSFHIERDWGGRWSLSVGGQWGFVDAGGRVVIPPRFEEVGRFSEGLAKYATNLDWDTVEKLLNKLWDRDGRF